MNRIVSSRTLYHALRDLIPNLPEKNVVSATLHLRVNSVATIELEMDAEIESGRSQTVKRTFLLTPNEPMDPNASEEVRE